MLSAMLSDIRLACRAMRRQPAFTAVVVGTLALGIGANTAMFSLIHAALLEPLPYTEPDRLVLARRTVGGAPRMLHSAPDYYDYREQTPGFESLAASRGGTNQATVTGGSGSEHVAAMEVSCDLFPTLGVTPIAGRWFASEEGRVGGPDVVMVSEGLARRRFGNARMAVGQTLTFSDGRVASTVVGVMPASFRFLEHADMWVVMRRGDNDGPETRRFHNWVLVGRLRARSSIDTVQRQVDVVTRRLQQEYPVTNRNKAMRLEPLQSALIGSQTPMLLTLMGAVALVLLVACANVAGLLIARGVARRSELAVRASLGASRGRIAAQLVTESVVLAGLSGLAGLVLAIWLQRLLPVAAGLAGSGIVARGVETPVLLFALAASLVTGVLSGVAPAARASSRHLIASLAPGSRATESKGGARLRSLLVVGQVALSLVLLVGAGLLLKSFSRLAATDLGFKTDGLFAVSVDQPFRDPAMRIQFQSVVNDELAAIPGVQATLTSHVPIRHPLGDPPMWPASRSADDASAQSPVLARVVAPGYFKTIGIPLISGRDLTAADRLGSAQVMVIDERMAAEFFPGQNPIGQHVMATGMVVGDVAPRDFEVVGVVGSARLNSVAGQVQATAYVSSRQFGMGRVNVLLRTSLPAAALTRTIRTLMAAKHPDIPIDPVVAMNDVVDETLVSRRVMALTLSAFSGVALGLAVLGLYGVLAFYVTQRRHEIGVRIALGANAGVILRQVLSRSALMVGPGLAVGLLASLAVARVMTRFLYQIQPTDAATYAGASLSLAAVAFVASAWSATRATRIDPVHALRGE